MLQRIRDQVLTHAATIMYDSATLPAKQLGEEVLPEPFSKKQHVQRRLEGGEEIGGSSRMLLEFLPPLHQPLLLDFACPAFRSSSVNTGSAVGTAVGTRESPPRSPPTPLPSVDQAAICLQTADAERKFTTAVVPSTT